MSAVLVVDGAVASRNRLAALLRTAGFEAVVASEPVGALVRLRTGRPAAVVGDMFLGSELDSRLVDPLLRDLAIDAIPALFVVEASDEALARTVAWIGSDVVVAPAGDDDIASAVSALIAARIRPRGLAHELNNLLTSIVGYSHLLTRYCDRSDPRYEDAQHILAAAERAAALTGTFLSPRSARRVGPAESAPTAAPETISREPVASNGGVVLVVADERPIRFLIQQVLQRAGYQVAEASTPADAQAWLDVHGPTTRLVIGDLGLPGAATRGFFERLAAGSSGPRILFISGQAERSKDAPLRPDVPFLEKPFTADDLLQRVRSLIDH